MAPTGSRKRIKPTPTSSNGAASPSPGRERSSPEQQGSAVNWYPGAWPAVSRSSKAAPVTEVARESISVAKNVASNVISSSTSHLESPKHFRNPSLQLTKKESASTRSLPANATTTCINIASDGSLSTPVPDTSLESGNPATQQDDKEESHDKGVGSGDEAAKTTVQIATSDVGIDSAESGNTAAPTTQTGGWLSWLYGSYASTEPPTTSPATDPSTQDETPEADSTEPDNKDLVAQDEVAKNTESTNPENRDTTVNTEVLETPVESQKRSWFQMWYGSSSSSKGDQPQEDVSKKQETTNETSTLADETNRESTNTTQSQNPETDNPKVADEIPQPPAEGAKSSGWSFWFKDNKSSNKGNTQDAQAVQASITHDSPPMSPANVPAPEPEQRVDIAKKGSVKIKTPPKDRVEPAVADGQIVPGLETEPPKTLPSKASEATASKQLQKILPNQVLPHFKDTFALQETPSLLQSIGRFLHYGKEANNRHVYMIKDPPHIRRALAIGIHGYFPAPLIRSVLGQPTGTSIRFSTMAAEAIHKWTEDHGYKCDIEKIALEGEGRISERIDLLWKLLLNWMDEIRKADFIMIACHSQGVPVAIMLVAKLISFGCLNAARVGVCAMAGVNMGPFADYRSRWISGSAGELFEFALPFSQVSKDYEAALKCALDFGVRISYVGSIDDQLVSLESSLFSPVDHPYIYRAAFVDGRVHAPSFLSHLVGFALKLRNLGISDHGLIRELSSPLAGSLYSGEGHSRLYDDESVYRLAIEFALETSNVNNPSLSLKRPYPPPVANPYILPFAMRGLLEEEYVRTDLVEETMELLRQFDNWKPASKVLKDVKFRLEGIRSKL